MIAELYNKISKMGTNLTDRREDQLTGDVFGNLRYLPFDLGIKPILQKSVYPIDILDCLKGIQLNGWNEKIYFWEDCRWNRIEPDVVIELGDLVILIEVKLYSGLSSNDDANDMTEADSQIELNKYKTNNQLGKESELLKGKYPNAKKRVLLLLAPEATAKSIYKCIREREENGDEIIAEGVDFGYMTWQKTLAAFHEITCENPFQDLIVQDIITLLKNKGFEQFKSFTADDLPTIDPGVLWLFEYIHTPLFRFDLIKRIRKGLYYEFE